MKTLLTFVALVAIVFFSSCDTKPGKKEKPGKKKSEDNASTTSTKDGVVEARFADGKLRASIPMKNGKKHGVAVEYFPSGSKYQEIEYKEGLKDGWARTYFEGGQLAQETPYVMGRMQGVQRKFRANGKTAAEATFYQDLPCKGLKEFLTDGKPKKKYPTIVITAIDRVLVEGVYTVRISLSEKVKEVEYFKGKLGEHGELGSEAIQLWTTDRYGVAQLKYNVPPGIFVMDKLNIIAKIKTVQGNYYITEGQFNVAAENR